MKKVFFAAALAVSAFGLSACSGAGAQQLGVQGQVGVGVVNAPPPGYYGPPPAYQGGYAAPGQYQQPRRVTGPPIAPQQIMRDHPPGTPSQYRCFPDGRPSGGPGTGTGWCDKPGRH